MTLGQALFDGLCEALAIPNERGAAVIVARATKVCYRTVNYWQRGEKDPRPSVLMSLADRFRVRLSREPGGSWVASVAGRLSGRVEAVVRV